MPTFRRGSASSRFAKLIRHFNFQQRTVVDPNTQEEITEEIPVLENVSLEASTDVTVAGEQVVTTASQYIEDTQIAESSITQHQAALSITESQISDYSFPSGTKMLFQQTSAPTGWTKDTTHNNKALRVVNGTAGSGGSVDFTTAFVSTRSVSGTVANHTLSTSQIPAHNHSISIGSKQAHSGYFAFTDNNTTSMGVRVRNVYGSFTSSNASLNYVNSSGVPGGQNVGYRVNITGSHNHTGSSTNTGGGGSHNHSWSGSVNMAVYYVDIIIATKD